MRWLMHGFSVTYADVFLEARNGFVTAILSVRSHTADLPFRPDLLTVRLCQFTEVA